MPAGKWDMRMLGLAEHVSEWSKDLSTQVGAVIADQKNRVVSLGYNGFPRGVEDRAPVSRDSKLRRTLHAEKNAILFAKRDLDGCTLYVTEHPCAVCAAEIIQSGITRVVHIPSSQDFMERWKADVREAQAMFAEAGVAVEVVLP